MTLIKEGLERAVRHQRPSGGVFRRYSVIQRTENALCFLTMESQSAFADVVIPSIALIDLRCRPVEFWASNRAYSPSLERPPPSTALNPELPPVRSALYVPFPLSSDIPYAAIFS
jgi:hypothetical protein